MDIKHCSEDGGGPHVTINAHPSRSAAVEPSATETRSAASNSSRSAEETTPREPTRQPRSSAEVIQAVGQLDGLRGWTIIPMGHFQRGDRHVVIAWPAINSSGQLRDATVVGVCLEESVDGDLEECGRRWVVREQAASRAALIAALGGSDYRIRTSNPGAELDDLGPRVSRIGNAFARAINSGNRNQARQQAIAFRRLLPASQVAFDNRVAQLLYMAGSYNGRITHERMVRDGTRATLTFHVFRSIIRVRTVTATAREVGDTGRWRIVSYRG